MNAIHSLYNRFRHLLPRKTATYSGIPVRDARLFDVHTRHPGHKDVLIQAIRARVSGSDFVCVMGGGRGIAAITAARAASDGFTVVFEAAREQCERTRRTVEESGVSPIYVKQAIVGGLVDAWGDTELATRLPLHEIGGDVWIVDIEGGEYALVNELTEYTAPETCIIETHPVSNTSVSRLCGRLTEIYDSVEVHLPTEDSTALGGPVITASN